MDWFIQQTFAVTIAIILDRVFGEPRRFHPLVGFGLCASRVQAYLNQGEHRFAKGIFGWCILVVPFAWGAGVIHWSLPTVGAVGLSAVITWFSIGGKSMQQHAQAVARPLQAGLLEQARLRVSYIVSRDCESMNEQQIASATVESVLENGQDAVFGAIFWSFCLGPLGGVLFRLANTLDAMWGYRTEQYRYFGCFAAHMDDVLGFVPARLTALSYCLCGQFRLGWQCWRTQARQCASPNGGPVMCAGAGALAIIIGGPAQYFGKLKDKPFMGCGKTVTGPDIERSCQLLWRAQLLWLAVTWSFVILWAWLG
ncbi:adenosylcobinamide-phosphate synthase CbiB [Celerinatantimonas sp. YJH-8]|uniref:adenosylcobinamide-phosphate synthase CbiB n=1 Tax=Celerinatantimonas sp. YJH-8 TaxID=3228714 RepID=UPI0038C3FC24